MTTQAEDFLVEIGTEELPSKSLHLLASSFAEKLEQEFNKAQLTFEKIDFFATPRRLAVWVSNVASKQQDRTIERLGPALALAYDKEGNPTPAALGFAKSCQVSLDSLQVKSTPKGECLFFNQIVSGDTFINLAPYFVKTALSQLPIPKPMQWGEHSATFIRPVHWLLMMYGESIIPCQLFELESDHKTYGHRFHHPDPIIIKNPQSFQRVLRDEGYVICDYEIRKEIIREQTLALGKQKGKVIIDEELLDEVTGLVEWPVALLGKFDNRFLDVPQEALISAMKYHQKCFPVFNSDNNLIPYFIFIANIESREPEEVIIGNERVIHARLADAEFFYHADLKVGITQYLTHLKTIIFQNKLGSLYDKASRIANLSGYIAEQLHCDVQQARRAGLLCKADLTTEMVGEFPELQGTMGYYYALSNKEPFEVAVGIKEHYQPRFSGDVVPTPGISSCVALADKIDTLVGIFGIRQIPTGEKDPFALRRAALGVLRILIENKLPLDLRNLLDQAAEGYPPLENENVVEETLTFIMDRLRAWYLEQDITPDVFAAVFARYPTIPFDFDRRIQAVQYFQKLPEAQALAAANKRVSNILKQASLPPHNNYNYALFEQSAEKALADKIEQIDPKIKQLLNQQDFEQALSILAGLRECIDQFFNEVMVMTENEAIRTNRLILLKNLRELFFSIADISLLQA